MAIKEIQLPNGETVVIDEWLHWPIYSTLVGQGNVGGSGNGATIDLRAFTYLVGDRIPTAGQVLDPLTGSAFIARDNDTNLVVRSKINHDEAIVVFSVTYEIFALSNDVPFGDPQAPDVQATDPIFRATNLRTLQRDCMLDVTVGAGIKKPQISAPFSYFGQGPGTVAYGPGDGLAVNYVDGGANVTNLALNYGTGGPISPRNQRRFQLPVYIHSDRRMIARFYSPNGNVIGLDQSWRLRIILDGVKRRPVG